MKRIVLTGGPGVGKTTMIEILKRQGHAIVPESARYLMNKLAHTDCVPWHDIKCFQERVAESQMANEEAHRTTDASFLFHDRSLVDGYAYCMHANVPAPAVVLENARGRYDTVFILDPLPLYSSDTIRTEKQDRALKLHDAIIDAYQTFGYSLKRIPVLPPDERVAYLLTQID